MFQKTVFLILVLLLVVFLDSVMVGCDSGENYEKDDAEVVILDNGHAEATGKMLSKLKIAHSFLGDYSTELRNPVLIIPTNGLDPSQEFKDYLREYVKWNGTIIVFSQEDGNAYSALPKGEVVGSGWQDNKGSKESSVGIQTYHHILSGQDSVTPDMNINGYFTGLPKNTEVLLNTTENDMPVMIMYRYEWNNIEINRKDEEEPLLWGTVIATTARPDWAYGEGESTEDELHLLRDMITWALDDQEEMPEFGQSDSIEISSDVANYAPATNRAFSPGETVQIPTVIRNLDDQDCDKIRFTLFDPDQETDVIEIPVSIAAGETATVDFFYQTTPTSKPGYYVFVGSLYNGDTWINDRGTGEFLLDVDASDLSSLTIKFKLRNPSGKLVRKETKTVTIPPGETQTVTFNYPEPFDLGIWSLEFEIFNQEGELQDPTGHVMALGEEYRLYDNILEFVVSKHAEDPEEWFYKR
ncbi:MAG: hypothetical protein HQ553_15000 [Chloroflexi bacterium]|nr:hypothetical protein [Chloroflexota bacterium]